MSTIRVARRDRYVVIDQETVRDRRLSLRARGLLVTLLSYPDTYRINSAELAKVVTEGRNAIRAALAELEDAGYLVRTKCQVAGGRWVTEQTLYETPGHKHADRESPGRTEDRFPGVGGPGVGFPGANYRKTIKKTVPRNVSRDGSRAACGQCEDGWLFDPNDGPRGTVRPCACRTG